MRDLVLAVKPRTVFHLASVVDVRPLRAEPVVDINVGGTVNLVVAAASCPEVCALVYCSTLDVVYAGRPMTKVAEDALPYTSPGLFPRLVAGNFYGVSKARAEEVTTTSSIVSSQQSLLERFQSLSSRGEDFAGSLAEDFSR